MGQSLSHTFHVVCIVAAPSALIRLGDSQPVKCEALLEKYSGREAILYRKVCEAPICGGRKGEQIALIFWKNIMAHGSWYFQTTRPFHCPPGQSVSLYMFHKSRLLQDLPAGSQQVLYGSKGMGTVLPTCLVLCYVACSLHP